MVGWQMDTMHVIIIAFDPSTTGWPQLRGYSQQTGENIWSLLNKCFADKVTIYCG